MLGYATVIVILHERDSVLCSWKSRTLHSSLHEELYEEQCRSGVTNLRLTDDGQVLMFIEAACEWAPYAGEE